MFEVIDTGVGIAPEHLPKLFQAFEQVGDRQKRAEGTGLGLAISQRIVQLMGSEIRVKSKLNQGSEFSFSVDLPIAEAEASGWQVSEESDRIIGYKRADGVSLAKNRLQILVVDDRWENRAVLKNLLEPLGFAVVEAENGQAGLSQIRTRLPDLVITDLVMPVMNGFEFLRCIRASEDLRALKVIVSSASVSQADQQLSLDQGGDDFLVKPVEAATLFQMVSNYIGLKWIYEPAAELAATPTERVLPPVAMLEELLLLAQQANLKVLREQVEQLLQTNSAYGLFSEEILRFARQFQVEEIEELLESYLSIQTAIQTEAAQAEATRTEGLIHAG